MMRTNPSNKQLLIGGLAAVLLLGAGGLAFTLTRPQAPPSAQAEAGHKDGDEHASEGGHADKEAPEGFVELTPEQIQAAGIQIVGVGQGSGGDVRISGRVEPIIDGRAVVAASVGGRVERVLAVPGQQVRAGQPLVMLVSGEAATFRADADAAAAEAEAARLAYQRDRNLFDQGVVARQEVETSRARSLSAEAAARAARARSSAAGAPNASGRLSVTSPISGVVTKVEVGPGGFVAQGGIVAEISNPERVEFVFRAPPSLASSVQVGATLRVTGPNGEIDTIVTGVAADADGVSSATLIRARLVGPRLPAGTAVSGVIVTGQSAGGITVPSDAVQTVEGSTVVFLRVEGGFKAVPVLIGRQAGGRTEILRGLSGDERVAGTNAFLLKAELAKGEAEHGH
jgi:cobalt-zinc-cadmium efflux system membrane fusion protein